MSQSKTPLSKRLIPLSIQGILTLFPLIVTIYLAYWFISMVERNVKSILEMILPDGWYTYFPGLGLLVGLAVLLVTGWLVNAYFIRKLIDFGERILERIPLIKTIFTSLRDLVGFMAVAKKQDAGSVVLVKLGEKKLIGFITDNHAGRTLGVDDPNLVGVYLPLGYMIGGYTVYMDKNELTHASIGAEEAMRLVLTGGMAKSTEKPEPRAVDLV
ncbi:membrane protein [Campylobacterota bacterium]|nr:membrane protein [Campylobacterota bacterium]